MKKLLAVAVVVSLLPTSSFASETTTEPAREPVREAPCTQWKGTVAGNDPSVAITATLCESGGRVTGRLVWTSTRSGSSVRTIAGAWTGGKLVLRDAKLDGAPNPGWRFCMVERYSLTGNQDRLGGTYRSSACNDDATISLVRVR